MKKAYLAVFILIVTGFGNVEAQYRINKNIYDYHNYSMQPDDPYNPALCAYRSFIFPGTGQIMANEIGRGIAFMAPTVVLWAGEGLFGLVALILYDIDGYVDPVLCVPLIIGAAGIAALHITSSIDASRVARVNNMAITGNRERPSLHVHPALYMRPGGILGEGISLTLVF